MNAKSLKLALKVLGRRKVFTAISLTGIVLTLLVLMVATAVIDNLFAPRVPQSRFDRMLFVTRVRQIGPNVTMQTNPGLGFLERTTRNLPGAERVSFYSEPQSVAIYERGRRVEAILKRTDAEFWNIFDFRFLEGGPFGAADVDAGRSVIVITDKTRDKILGRGPALGKTVVIGDTPHRIVGVVPAVSIEQALGPFAEMWTPATQPTADDRKAVHGNWIGAVLARSERDIRPMQREFQSRVARVPIEDPKSFRSIKSDLDTPFEQFVHSIGPGETGDRSPAIVIGFLVLVALLFMTLPALNLVTLNLSRILERAPEIGVRKAFGAPRRALIAQFVSENVVLTLIGGAISFLLTYVVLRLLEWAELMPDAHFSMNVRVFVIGMLIAAFFGVFSGFYPAWRMSRLNPVNALRGGSL